MDEPQRAKELSRARKPSRDDPAPLAEEILRVAKALRAGEPDQPRAAQTEKLAVATPPPPPPPPPPAPPVEPEIPVRAPRATEVPSRVATPITHDDGPTPGSIGWLWPDETATRGGGGGRWRPPGRWRYRAVALAAAGAVVLAAAGVLIGISLHSTHNDANGGNSSPKATGRPSATAPSTPSQTSPATTPPSDAGLAQNITSAATWIKQQIAVGTHVACDQQTCTALTESGYPAGEELQVGLNSQSLSGASIIVMTPQLRVFFSSVNSRLGNEVADTILAHYGLVTIQVVYQSGAAAYQAALSQDVQERQQVGGQLLSGRVTASSIAGTELAAGRVDPRLLLVLKTLSAQQPIDVLAFADAGPGASPDVPLRVMDLAITDPASGLTQGAYLQSLRQMLQAGTGFPPYTKIEPTTVDGQTAVQIEYAAPSPLNLLST
jgi:hypothetical protein